MQERKLEPIKFYRDIPKWAVIVGISEYKYTNWNLSYAHRDAEELCKLLQTDNGGNFQQQNIRLLVNQQATSRNIRKALKTFLKQPQENDLVLIYFACHGAPDSDLPDNKYLLTYDTEHDDISGTALEMEVIKSALTNTVKAQKIIVLADTCHSGGINYRDINYRDIDNPDTINFRDNSAQVTRYLQQLNNSQGGVAIVTSAEATQKSQEAKQWGGGHGVFTHFVLEGMRGKADTNNDGIVTAGELFEYVRENVKQATNNAQIPFIDANRFDRNLPIAITEIKNINPQTEEDNSTITEDFITGILGELEEENAEEEYRATIREYLAGNEKINYLEELLLEKKAQELNFNEVQAEKMLQEEINKNSQSKQKLKQAFVKYENLLQEAILNDQYPFNSLVEKRLKEIQNYLKLSDQQVAEISKPILEQAEFIDQKGNKKFSFEVITVDDQGQVINRSNNTARFFSEDLGNGVELEMVAIPGGEFLMGTAQAEIDRLVKKFGKEYFKQESPQHLVNIKPFMMGKYPVTQAQWQAVMGNNRAKFQDSPQHPVEQVSWDDAQKFCQRLSQTTALEYRLPTEAEWEYAARAGTNTPFYFGETISTDLANYRGTNLELRDKVYPGIYANEPTGKFREKTTKVGIFPPNKFGLYDIHGNVWEWCEDDWHKNYHGAPNDGSVWLSKSSTKVVRGGSWYDVPNDCRSALRIDLSRDIRNGNFGFRVVCVIPRTT